MKNGFRIEWSDNALNELKETYKYLEINWTEKEIKRLSSEIEKTVNLISQYPQIFPLSDKMNIRRVVILKAHSLYYMTTKDNKIQILSFFANRQNPNKRNF